MSRRSRRDAVSNVGARHAHSSPSPALGSPRTACLAAIAGLVTMLGCVGVITSPSNASNDGDFVPRGLGPWNVGLGHRHGLDWSFEYGRKLGYGRHPDAGGVCACEWRLSPPDEHGLSEFAARPAAGPVTVGELEPDSWSIGGFASVSAATVSISADGRRAVSDRDRRRDDRSVFADTTRRNKLLGCTPKSATDTACFQSFVTKFGRLAWRQPLTAAQVTRYTNLIASVAATMGDVYEGMRAGMQGLLLSPNFLYRLERGRSAGRGGNGFWQYTERRDRHPPVVLPDELDAGRDAAGSGGPKRAADEGGRSWRRRIACWPRRPGANPSATSRPSCTSCELIASRAKDPKFTEYTPAAADGDDAGDSGDVRVDRLRSKRQRPGAPDHPQHVRHQGARHALRAADDGALVDDADARRRCRPTGLRAGLLTTAGFLSLYANQEEGSPTQRGKFIRADDPVPDNPAAACQREHRCCPTRPPASV